MAGNPKKCSTGWRMVSLKQVARQMLHGGTPSTKIPSYWQGDIPWVTGADFEDQEVVIGRRYISRKAVEASATNVIPKGHLLILTRTGVSKVAAAPCDIAISQDITGVIVKEDEFCPKFIFQQLDRLSGRLKTLIQGTSIKGLLREDLETFAIPAPSLPEQRRIAEILNAVDAAIDATHAVIAQTRCLKSAILNDLLTHGVPGKKAKLKSCKWLSQYPATWSVVPLGSLLREPIKNGYSPVCPREASGIWILTLSAVSSEGYNEKGVKPAPLEDERVLQNVLEVGDIVVSRSNTQELVGLAGVYSGKPSRCSYSDLLMRVRIDPKKVDNDFVSYAFLSAASRAYFERTARGTSGSMKKIDRAILEALPIPLPKLSDQQQIAKTVKQIDVVRNEQINQFMRLQNIKSALSQALLTGPMHPDRRGKS